MSDEQPSDQQASGQPDEAPAQPESEQSADTSAPAQEQPPPQGDGPDDGESEPDYRKLYEDTLSEARKWEQRAKSNRDKADKFDELDAQNKTEAQKATERAEQAEQRYQQAIDAAIRAEVKAAATNWADPDDAPRYLDDLSGYVTEEGEINTKAIRKDVAAALKQRPYLGKPQAPSNGHGMAPDPSQGATGASMADQISAAEQSGDVQTSLALKAEQLLANQ